MRFQRFPASFRLAWTSLAVLLSTNAAALRAQEEQAPVIETTTALGIATGTANVYLPGRWGEFRLSVTNPTDGDLDFLSASYFEPDSNLQFGRRFWVPAHARRFLWQPIRVPFDPVSEKETVTIRTFLSRVGEGEETTFIKQRFDELQKDLYIRVIKNAAWTAIADDNRQGTPGKITVVDSVITARTELGQTRTPIFLNSRVLPSTEAGLDALDQLVIADNRISTDAAGLESVRSWMFNGGKLWVMLDRVDPLLLEYLLGDDFDVQVVDRVGLTDVKFETIVAGAPVGREPIEYELPVDHVRVLQTGFDVTYTVNGWPAALSKRCGQGSLLITTLAVDGWVRPRVAADPRAIRGDITDYYPTEPFMRLMTSFYAARETQPVPQAAAEEHLQGFVGYSIPSRGTILGVLSAFTATVAAAGLLLARAGRLEWLGIIAPIAGLVAGGTLVQAGNSQRSSVPSKAALVQLVQPLGGTSEVAINGTAGLFLADQTDGNVSGRYEGWVYPDMTGQEGTTRRMVWGDLGHWKWEHVRAVPSLRFAPFSMTVPTKGTLTARPTLNDQGLTGQLQIPEGLAPTDAVVIGPAGRMAVDIKPDGSWSSTTGQVLSREQFLAADVLSDEQNRRLQTLKALLATQPPRFGAESPALLFWTQPWDMGVTFPESVPTDGSALVAIPLSIERPAADTTATIPTPWLPYREAIGPDGVLPGGLFDNRKLVWADKAVPGSTWIRFETPPALYPFEIESAKLNIDVSGPVGLLEVSGYRDGQVVPLQTWRDPVGRVSVEISDPKALSVDDHGRVSMRISGGDPSRPELTMPDPETGVTLSYWRLESVGLELKVKIHRGGPSGLPH